MMLPALFPLISELPKHEQETWIQLITLVPPLLVASIQVGKKLRINDIEPQWFLPDEDLILPADYERKIEPTVRAAVSYLNKIGIRTYWSSGNKYDATAMIIIETKYLTAENLKIAIKFFDYKGNPGERVGISMKITDDTPADDVAKQMLKMAKKFKKQI